MKKLLMVLAASLFLSTASFADVYLNFTIPESLGWHFQEGKGDNPGTFQFLTNMEVTGEVFSTFSGAFGMGIKAGYEWATKTCILDYGDDTDTVSARGWFVGPALGWANDSSSTKKKITLYPITYETWNFRDVGSKDDDKYSLMNYRFGAAFSFQWGAEAVQNGFEFGFNGDWNSIFHYDGEELSEAGTGFNFFIGYKLSFVPVRNQ